VSEQPQTGGLSDAEREYIQSHFNQLMDAYRAGQADAERDDRFDKWLAAQTSSNVTQQLVEAIERLAAGPAKEDVDPKAEAAAATFNELEVVMNGVVAESGPGTWVASAKVVADSRLRTLTITSGPRPATAAVRAVFREPSSRVPAVGTPVLLPTDGVVTVTDGKFSDLVGVQLLNIADGAARVVGTVKL
jgi:hypothetical protein